MNPAQIRLALESIQSDENLVEEEPPAPAVVEALPRKRQGGGRRPVPVNLPLVREVIDVPESERMGMEKIREEVTEEIATIDRANISVGRSCDPFTRQKQKTSLPCRPRRPSVSSPVRVSEPA